MRFWKVQSFVKHKVSKIVFEYLDTLKADSVPFPLPSGQVFEVFQEFFNRFFFLSKPIFLGFAIEPKSPVPKFKSVPSLRPERHARRQRLAFVSHILCVIREQMKGGV